ncbi:PREDICTED: uncharacterized protein LOC109159096 isoform X1 [Ipomoea nil]|uniref:uncharacterized protein LOC109159096 isoform X1 n=1 Tax=Ipomoea nil TaxID=35883 RepID=UPI0009011315|nr:PREDICTED: uncharacterized protein LOC109159096 isoform X1 [Ipomoea nil]
MDQQQQVLNFSVTWRGKKFTLEMEPGTTLKALGDELRKLTNVEDDTMRLIVPINKSSKLIYPFSKEHSYLKLDEASILQGKSLRMLGVPRDEVDEVLERANEDLRIAGFEEEEKRQRQRIPDRLGTSLKLPQGPYIFCDFRTLHLPGIELNPPTSEALKLMHKLAADPGIVAIMNKHRWRVGLMSEMAPVGYVGVSPKCLLGLNKNQGEEISLRLRTDDLKGFRKYQSIKKTLLHELAHMIYSDHDANFYALDKQLNEEAATLDWTKSRSHTLSGLQHLENNEDDVFDNYVSSSQKLGGKSSFSSARVSSVAAAYRRFADTSANHYRETELHQEPDPDDHELLIHHMDVDQENDLTNTKLDSLQEYTGMLDITESCDQNCCEPDPDEATSMKSEASIESNSKIVTAHKNSDYHETISSLPPLEAMEHEEPDPDDSEKVTVKTDFAEAREENQICRISDSDEPLQKSDSLTALDLNDKDATLKTISCTHIDEPDPDDQELRRIQDPVVTLCSNLQRTVELLKAQASPLDAARVLQTLIKIIKNVIEHPDEVKFKKLKKANPIIKRDVLNYKAAMDVLALIGFSEDVLFDETGRTENYLVLKRNDPGLLWLAKSSLETYIA